MTCGAQNNEGWIFVQLLLNASTAPQHLLYVRHLLANKRDLEILVNVDLLGTKIDNFVGLAESGSHLVRSLAQLVVWGSDCG